MTDPADVVLQVAEILDALGIRYAVGGSLASSRFGEPRATNDIDMVVDLPEGRVPSLVAALRPAFDVWEDTVLDAVRAGRSFSAVHVEGSWKVDFFPVGRDRLAVRQVDRAVTTPLGGPRGRGVKFTSPEDVILRKLEWFRRSGGVLERQLRDVTGVMKVVGPRLDLDDMRRTARDLGLAELLEACLRESGLAP